jgi:hypothetical protein
MPLIRNPQVIGRFHYSDSARLVYIDIPKCATNTIHTLARSLYSDWQESHIYFKNKLTKYTLVTAIREPFNRYISGVCEYEQRKKRITTEHLKKHVFMFDEHTRPQYHFLEPFTHMKYNVSAIVMNDNFEENLLNHFKLNGKKSNKQILKLNTMKYPERKEQVKNLINKEYWELHFEGDLLLIDGKMPHVNIIR